VRKRAAQLAEIVERNSAFSVRKRRKFGDDPSVKGKEFGPRHAEQFGQ
jgi:hypothetical protein